MEKSFGNLGGDKKEASICCKDVIFNIIKNFRIILRDLEMTSV